MSKVFESRDRDSRTTISSTGNMKRSCFGLIGGDQYKGTRTYSNGTTTSARGDSVGAVASRLRRGRRGR